MRNPLRDVGSVSDRVGPAFLGNASEAILQLTSYSKLLFPLVCCLCPIELSLRIV